MSHFVEECRREWKRLRVPAQSPTRWPTISQRISVRPKLTVPPRRKCSAAALPDPRAFAAAWASERGIVRPRRLHRLRKRWLVVLASFIVFVLLVVAAGLIAALSVTESSAPRTATTVAPAVVAPGRIIGTSIFGARVTPSNVALATGRRTVLHRHPQAITITFGNTGGQIVQLAHLTVRIGLDHTYQFTARRMAPNSHTSVRIAVPSDLPSTFKVLAVTRPLPGEANTQNNERIWRVTVAK